MRTGDDMSKKSNVNPDHYKTAGRDPIGQAVVQERQKQKLKKTQVQTRQGASKRRAPRRPPAARPIA